MKMNPYFWPKNPKANFPKNQVFVSSCKIEGYETNLDFSLKNPKANFLKNRVTVNSCNTECYETNLDFWPKNPKANSKPISTYCLAPNFMLGVLFSLSSKPVKWLGLFLFDFSAGLARYSNQAL
jgi:hypothetical protein